MSQLSSLVESQLQYHRQAVQVLEELSDKLRDRCSNSNVTHAKIMFPLQASLHSQSVLRDTPVSYRCLSGCVIIICADDGKKKRYHSDRMMIFLSLTRGHYRCGPLFMFSEEGNMNAVCYRFSVERVQKVWI